MAKTERLDLRLSAEQKETIEKAAILEGTTVSGFTVAAVMDRAHEALYRAGTLTLPAQAWDEFVRILDSQPPVPDQILHLLSQPSVLEE